MGYEISGKSSTPYGGVGSNLDGKAYMLQAPLSSVDVENAPEVKQPSQPIPEVSNKPAPSGTETTDGSDKDGPGMGDIPTSTKDAKLWILNRADVA